MYKETFSAVRVGGNLTEWFKTVVGVLQGCVLSPLLFNIFLEIIIITAIDDDASGAWLNGVRISDLCFADDIALLAETKQQLQHIYIYRHVPDACVDNRRYDTHVVWTSPQVWTWPCPHKIMGVIRPPPCTIRASLTFFSSWTRVPTLRVWFVWTEVRIFAKCPH